MQTLDRLLARVVDLRGDKETKRDDFLGGDLFCYFLGYFLSTHVAHVLITA
jgi:hypothetical protein